MALTTADELHGFLEDLDLQIGRAIGGKYTDTSMEVGDVDVSRAPETEMDVDGVSRTHGWCERSLEQLELTIQLVDQCLDNDVKELARQGGIIEACREEVQLMKGRL